jgi:hypothetical protein
MFLCPLCGAMFTRAAVQGAFVDEELYHHEDLALQGCLCYFNLASLEQTVVHCEERLNKQLSARFPGKTLKEIPREIGKLDRHAPLRTALIKKMGNLQRARERLLELRKKELAKEQQEEHKTEIVEQSITGCALSLHDWVTSFTK